MSTLILTKASALLQRHPEPPPACPRFLHLMHLCKPDPILFVEIDGKFYCMAPPNYKCGRSVKDVGKFTEGEKKILYCKNRQYPYTKCK